MDGYDPAAIWADGTPEEKIAQAEKEIAQATQDLFDGWDAADKKIRKEKLLELVKRFPKEYQISEFANGMALQYCK